MGRLKKRWKKALCSIVLAGATLSMVGPSLALIDTKSKNFTATQTSVEIPTPKSDLAPTPIIDQDQIHETEPIKVYSSVVDYLSDNDQPTTYKHRKSLYKTYFNNASYSGTAIQNTSLLEALINDPAPKLTAPRKSLTKKYWFIRKDKMYGNVTNSMLDEVLEKEDHRDCSKLFQDLTGLVAKDAAGHQLLPAAGKHIKTVKINGGQEAEDDFINFLTTLDKESVYLVGLGQDYYAPIKNNPHQIDIRHIGFMRYCPSKYYSFESGWEIISGGLNRIVQEQTADYYPFYWHLGRGLNNGPKMYVYEQNLE